MKRIIIVLACSLFFSLTNGQDIPGRQATAREQARFEKSQNCDRTKSIPPAQRLKLYPFNTATQVQLVSFKSSFDLTGEYFKDSLPRMNDTICYSRLFEVKTLTSSQIDNLTDLVFNYGYKFEYKPKGNVYFIATSLQCYNPKNAILFLDKNKKVFEFIEICFECDKTTESSDKVNLGENCNQKLQLIRNFFKESKIEYGTTKSVTDDN